MGTSVVAKKTRYEDLEAKVRERAPIVGALLPTTSPLRVGQLIQSFMVATLQNPDVLRCTDRSLFVCLWKAAQYGLDPSGVLGQAAIVPFRDRDSGTSNAVLMPMYQGMIDLARRSAKVLMMEAHVVRQADEFDLQYGTEPHLIHKPVLQGRQDDAKDVIGAYAVASLADGLKQWEYLSREELDQIRRMATARTKGRGPWDDWPVPMYRKTAVRRICKFIPKSIELAESLAMETAAEAGKPIPFTDDIPAEYLLGLDEDEEAKPRTQTEKVKKTLGVKGKKQAKEEKPPEEAKAEQGVSEERALLEAEIDAKREKMGWNAKWFGKLIKDWVGAESIEEATVVQLNGILEQLQVRIDNMAPNNSQEPQEGGENEGS